MKAMVLAAGVGSRLRPATDSMPKALIDVGGQTMLERVLRRLMAAGATQVIVNSHHFPEQIADFLRKRQDLGLAIEISEEPVLLETGGGLKKASWFFDDGKPFFLHNADVLSDVDLKALYAAHEGANALATLAVHKRESSRQLLFDAAGRLRGRRQGEKIEWAGAPATNVVELAFAGIHVISPKIFPLLTETGAFSIIDPYLRLSKAGERVQAFRVDSATWFDIGSAEKLERARKHFSSSR
jgi:NDP-sugar pyrophosphorylase family protein